MNTELQQWFENHLTIFILLGIALVAGYFTNRWLWGTFLKKLTIHNPIAVTILQKAFKGWITYFIYIATSFYISLHLYSELYTENTITIAKVIIVILFTLALSRLTGAWFRVMFATAEGNLSIISNVARVIVFLIGGMFILRMLHISITPMLTALGVGGLAVALALQDTLGNVFAGINIIAGKKLQPGDFIRLENNAEGCIEDISWRTSSIRLQNNTQLIIPNSKLANSILVNMTNRRQEQSIVISFNISYGSDLDKVETITLEVARTIQQHLGDEQHDAEASVRYSTFTDTGITLNVGFKIKDYRDQYSVRHEFIKALHKRYEQEGIIIPVVVPGTPLKTKELQ